MCRGICDFKKGYQCKTKIIKNENSDLVADSLSILAWWKNHFSQLLSIHEVNDVRQTDIHTAELLVPEPRALEVELAIEKPNSHKSPGTDQIPVNLIKSEGRTVHYEIYKLISIWNKDELPEEWKELIIAPICKKDNKTDRSNYSGISLLPTTYKILTNILLSRLTPYAEEIIGGHQCGFQRNRSTIDHVFCIVKYLKKIGIQ